MVFQYKINKVKKTLTHWSRETFGNIFHKIATLKDTIKVMELKFEENPLGRIGNSCTRHKIN